MWDIHSSLILGLKVIEGQTTTKPAVEPHEFIAFACVQAFGYILHIHGSRWPLRHHLVYRSCIASYVLLIVLLLDHVSCSLLLRSRLSKVAESLPPLELSILNDTSIRITREVAGPLHERGTLKVTASDGIETDGGQDAGVGELGLRGDDGVGDVVVDGGVLFLLHFEDGVVLEGPADDVRVWGGALILC